MRVANVERLTEYPALQACAGLQLPDLTQSQHVTYTPAPAPTSPAEHLHALQEILTGHGFTTYFDRIHTATNGIATVHMHIPGLERFHLITDGSVVLPGNRARAAVRHGVSSATEHT
jgi:ribosomal protein S12 methylthiotransferase accessory factor